MLLLLSGLDEQVFLARELACKLLIIPTQIANNCNYYSVRSLACIILLLSGFIQYYYSYMPNLSFDNRAYGQEQTVEIDNGRVSIGDGQEQTVDGKRSEDSSNDDETSSTPKRPTAEEAISEDKPPPQQAQPTTPLTTATEEAASEDNSSDQSTGPVRFTFVDSFWTDYTSLGGVIASTSSESTTVQPLPPATRQEVEPGEGEAVLAVVLRNRGFADATSISGSLDLPSGFGALVTPENVDSDTVLASYNGIVKAGQTFTLYFRVEIAADSQVGREYTGELRVRYFKVDEQEDEDTRSTTLEIPFRLSGKVILNTAAVATASSSASTQGIGSSLSQMVSVNPGIVNPLKIEISNNGSAIATGVLVNVLPSSTVSSTTTSQGGGDGSSANINNSAGDTTSATVQQQLSSSSSTPATMVIVGSPTFNIGLIDANERKEIVPTIFPADAAAGTLTTLNIQISYNDAYGNKRTQNQVLGIQISPESPQSGLSVLPTSSASLYRLPESLLATPLTHTSFGTSSSNNTMSGSDVNNRSSSTTTTTNSSSTQPQSIQIAAGSIQDLSFAIANNNNAGVSIADAVVSLTSESSAVRILGDSRWNLQSIAAGSQQELSTRVYASTSLIGSPVFFTVTMQYIRNGNEVRTDSFQLGAIVVGNIRISVNDVTISYIGDTPTLVGNLLNEGNTPALFTKIELLQPATQGKPQLLRPTVSSEFLGDLAVNSPLAFNIPLQIAQQNTAQEVTVDGYPISLRITYSDELRNPHELVVDETISLEPIQPMISQQTGSPSQGNAAVNNGFVDAYWADSVAASPSTTSSNLSNAAGSIASTLPAEREVGPGEGPSFLAVVLSNTAFSDITGIIGYLQLPEGFAAATTPAATTSTNDSSANTSSGQTSIASLSNIVRAGQTYTLYFKVNVLETAQKGFHEALLRINYFKVPEPEPGTYRVQTITVPFELPGKVILDATSEANDLVPGEANEVKLMIRNRGSADAHSVIVNINAIGGSIIT